MMISKYKRKQPKYRHDCEACQYIGTYWTYKDDGHKTFGDLYLCGDTILIRRSSKDSDYYSMTISRNIITHWVKTQYERFEAAVICHALEEGDITLGVRKGV